MEIIFIFIFGLAMGSFLNVLAYRIPKGKSIFGRSHCDHCKKKLEWIDLVPVASYLCLRGRCRYCKKSINPGHLFAEVTTALVFVVTWQFAPVSFPIRIVYLGIVSILIAILFADAYFQIIPDIFQVIFFILVLFLHVVTGVSVSKFLSFFLSGLAVMSVILFLFLITRGRGMGFGDVKLAFTIGFLLGLKGGLIALYIGFVSGALVGLALILIWRKKLKSKIAFGPFLVLGIWLVLVFQQPVFFFIHRLYGL